MSHTTRVVPSCANEQGLPQLGHPPQIFGGRHGVGWLLVTALVLGLGGMARAEEPSGKATASFAQSQEQPVKAELVAEHTSVQPVGQTRVGVSFNIQEGWHIYAEHPGDAGLPTKVTWKGPSWVSFGPLNWPTPERFQEPGATKTFGYRGAVLLQSTLTCRLAGVAGNWPVPMSVGAHVEWLACKNICVPGEADLTIPLPVSNDPPALSTHAELFEHTN